MLRECCTFILEEGRTQQGMADSDLLRLSRMNRKYTSSSVSAWYALAAAWKDLALAADSLAILSGSGTDPAQLPLVNQGHAHLTAVPWKNLLERNGPLESSVLLKKAILSMDSKCGSPSVVPGKAPARSLGPALSGLGPGLDSEKDRSRPQKRPTDVPNTKGKKKSRSQRLSRKAERNRKAHNMSPDSSSCPREPSPKLSLSSDGCSVAKHGTVGFHPNEDDLLKQAVKSIIPGSPRSTLGTPGSSSTRSNEFHEDLLNVEAYDRLNLEGQ